MLNHSPDDLTRTADDVVIVGGGLAGLFCALKLAPRPVTVISAAPLGQGASTAWAQGGIAAAVAEGDSAEAHAADTVAVGGGLVDETIALGLAREAGARIHDLLQYGVPFDRDLEGKLAVGREAAHSARRIVHVRGDMAGKAIISALIEAVRNTPSIRVIEGLVAEALLTEDGAVLAVVTNKPGDLARSLLGALGIAASFDAIIGDGDGFPRKPDPAAALSILAKVGVSPDRAVMVGDGLPDLRLARALGVTAVAATWGYVPAASLARETPAFLAGSFQEAILIIRGAEPRAFLR